MVGSFLNVCVYRLPKEESIVFPGSHCGACGKAVRGYDNIPILSYFILRGRCRDCKTKFSIQYALVEAFTGILFVIFYRTFGATAAGIVFLIFTLAILTESLIDFRHKIIPDSITLPGIVLGLALAPVISATHGLWLSGLLNALTGFDAGDRLTAFLDALAGVLIGGGFLYFVAWAGEKILKKEAMGGGDIKLLAMIGAFLGLRGVLWSVFIGSLLGTLAAVYYRFKKDGEEIPFGPFLGLASVLYIFFGDGVIRGYLELSQRLLYRQ